jgi:flagellar export protein FliJ
MFRFRLQSVLELRQAVEKESAVVLNKARVKADAARDERSKLEDALMQNIARLHGGQMASSVGEMRARSDAVTRLEARVRNAAEQVDEAETAVVESDVAFQAAFRERHVLDRLKDRYSLLWRVAATKGELSEMDSIALARFAAASTAPGEESS